MINLPPAVRVLFPTVRSDSQFFVKVFNDHRSLLSKIHNRAVERSNGFILTIPDVDPKRAGNQSASIDLRANANDSGAIVAMKFALFGAWVSPLILADEANRYAMGLPVGPKSKLKGAKPNHIGLPEKPGQNLPKSLDAATGGDYDDEIHTIDPATVRALTVSEEGEPISVTAIIISVVIPIVIALIPIVLPMLVEMGKGAFQVAGNAAGAMGGMGGMGASDFVDANKDGIPDSEQGASAALVTYGPWVAVAAALAIGAYFAFAD